VCARYTSGVRKFIAALAFALPLALAGILTVFGHNGGAGLTWNREISRVFFRRCAECHRDGGSAFSLMTFAEVQPHLAEIKHQVLNRLMPPWGAVKGFGDFRNDQGLTQEEIELIVDWIEGDARRGNNANALPPIPKFAKPSSFSKPKGSLHVQGDLALVRPFILDGLFPERLEDGSTARVVAHFPDSHVEPLIWFNQYNQRFQHPFFSASRSSCRQAHGSAGYLETQPLFCCQARNPPRGSEAAKLHYT